MPDRDHRMPGARQPEDFHRPAQPAQPAGHQRDPILRPSLPPEVQRKHLTAKDAEEDAKALVGRAQRVKEIHNEAERL